MSRRARRTIIGSCLAAGIIGVAVLLAVRSSLAGWPSRFRPILPDEVGQESVKVVPKEWPRSLPECGHYVYVAAGADSGYFGVAIPRTVQSVLQMSQSASLGLSLQKTGEAKPATWTTPMMVKFLDGIGYDINIVRTLLKVTRDQEWGEIKWQARRHDGKTDKEKFIEALAATKDAFQAAENDPVAAAIQYAGLSFRDLWLIPDGEITQYGENVFMWNTSGRSGKVRRIMIFDAKGMARVLMVCEATDHEIEAALAIARSFRQVDDWNK